MRRDARHFQDWRFADLDRLAREAVSLRSGGRCERCGALAADAHHVHGRGILTTRWMLENLVALCRPCHELFHSDRRPELLRWWTERVGSEVADRLNLLVKNPHDPDPEQARKALERYIRRRYALVKLA